jgi:hypothetical protein
MKEITPATDAPKTLVSKLTDTAAFPVTHKSFFMLTFGVQPAEAKKGKFGIAFLPEKGVSAGCEFQIALDELRAQFAPASIDGFASRYESLREGGAPQQAGNYAIENLIGVGGSFTVRVIVKDDDKIGGSLIDAEVAGQRTLISYRPDLTVKKLCFRVDGVEFSNVQLAPLKK